jgi:hypothetical protein
MQVKQEGRPHFLLENFLNDLNLASIYHGCSVGPYMEWSLF